MEWRQGRQGLSLLRYGMPLNPHGVAIFVAVPTTDCQMAWTQPLSGIQAVSQHGHGLKASLIDSDTP